MAGTYDFLNGDLYSTLFPLKSNLIMARFHGKEISEYIYQKVLNKECEFDNFLPQQTVYATKPRGHLRRTVKLDPVADYFIYDLVLRNKAIFRKQVSDTRRSFGYRIFEGAPVPIHGAYSEYKECLSNCLKKYRHNIKFDIASYFNSIYHHDLVNWFESKKVSDVDLKSASQYFREINAGRSVDFLPQGIYPCKMIGNEFLKFVDLHGVLKSSRIVRFMDDFSLFDDDPLILRQDFVKIQQLIGKYALNVNPSKTHYDMSVGGVEEKLSDIRHSLREIVRDFYWVGTPSGAEIVESGELLEHNLNEEQLESILALLQDESVDESDVDLILGFLRSHSESLLELMPSLLLRFPSQIKNIYSICHAIQDKGGLIKVIYEYLNTESVFLEYQLFWIATILEDYLYNQELYGECLWRIYELSSSFVIVRAKILEIPESGFGLKEVRDDYLKTGQSDWLSWSSAIGSRALKAGERNYGLSYFSRCSPMNSLVAGCVKKI